MQGPFAGSIVAIVTPMQRDGKIDYAAWQGLLEWHLQSGTAGIVVCGTTGESPTVTDAELRELVQKARAMCRGRVPIIAGAGLSSTAATVDRARWLSALGLDALLVVTPAYNKPTQGGMQLHFEAVAAVSAVPIILYNVPGRTAVDLLPATVERLRAVRNIVGIKEAVADIERIKQLCAFAGPQFAVLSGDDATAREAVLAGAAGVISVTANLAPRGMSDMIAAARAADATRATALDRALQRLHRDLFIEGNPIPAKWCLSEMGRMANGIRLPLTPLSERYHPLLREAMRLAGIETPGHS
jgi:4-hydroxy-tetrahydrodipicolinate synthase